jgi:hypothetical protein
MKRRVETQRYQRRTLKVRGIEEDALSVNTPGWSQQLYKEQFLSVQSSQCVNFTTNKDSFQWIESNVLKLECQDPIEYTRIIDPPAIPNVDGVFDESLPESVFM